MKAVLYLRYSSHSQTEQSIEGQERECTEYCRKNGLTIVGKYVDRATSASKNIEKRTEFLRMMNDSSTDKFDAVVVWSIDRFARSTKDASYYKAVLKANNVKLLSTKETIPDDPTGIIIGTLFDAMAEYYSAELSTKVTRGMHETALKGQSLGSYPPAGYKVNKDKKYVIDEEKAEFIKKAWKMFSEGSSQQAVKEYLKSVGVKNAAGKDWTYNSLRRMFENEKYIGIYESMGVRIEDAIPPLIDTRTWVMVQNRLKGGKSTMYKTPNDYLFSSNLYCSKCGERMVAYSGTGGHNKKQYLYYRCKNHNKKKTDPLYCEATPIRKEYLEQAVIEDTYKLFMALDLDTLSDYLYENLERFVSVESMPTLETRIDKIQKQIENLTDAIANVGYNDSIGKRLKAAEDELKELYATREELLIILPAKEELKEFLYKTFSSGNLTYKEKENIAKLIVDRIDYDCDQENKTIRIVYNLWGQTAIKKNLRIQEKITAISEKNKADSEQEKISKPTETGTSEAGSRFYNWCTSRDSNPGPTD